MPRTRRTATRSLEPRSPPKRLPTSSTQSPRRTVRNAHDTSHDTTKTLSRRFRAERSLDTVDEQDQQRAAVTVSVPRDDDSVQDEDLSVSDVSMSGSASSDDIDTQLAELDRDLMVDNLSAVFHDATQILSLFASDDIPRLLSGIQSYKSTLIRRLGNLITRLHLDTKPFLPANELIRPRLVARKLAETSEVIDGPWRPDAVLFIVNLAIILARVVVAEELHILEAIAPTFPETFLIDKVHYAEQPAGSRLGETTLRSTLDLSLSVRTQYFLLQMSNKKAAPFDPDGMLRQTFFDEDDHPLGLELSVDDDVLEDFKTAFLAQIEDIRDELRSKRNKSVTLDRLRARYPYAGFVSDLITWAQQRTKELTGQITRQGGIDAIIERIENKNFDRYETTSSIHSPAAGEIDRQQEPAVLTGKNSGRLSGSLQSLRKNMPRFKAIMQSRNVEDEDESSETSSQNPGRSGQVRQESPILGDTSINTVDEIPPSAQGDAEPAQPMERSTPPREINRNTIVPSQETAMILAAARKQAVQSNKENLRFRYPDSDVTDDVVETVSRTNDRPNPKPRDKHRFIDRQEGATVLHWGNDEDNDFENDLRPVKRVRLDESVRSYPPDVVAELNSRSRLAQDGTVERRPRREPRSASAEIPEASHSPRQTDGEAAVNNNTARPSPSAPARSLSHQRSPVLSQYEQAKRQGRENMQLYQAISGRRNTPQIRREWEVEETDRLVESIARFGTRWSTILADDQMHPDGPKLQRRSQVQLKDKARNLKLDLLKAHFPLPEGFAGVSLKTKDIEELDRRGIPHLGGAGGRGVYP